MTPEDRKEVFKKAAQYQREKAALDWMFEWGNSVEDCLENGSDMFKPCIQELRRILKDKNWRPTNSAQE